MQTNEAYASPTTSPTTSPTMRTSENEYEIVAPQPPTELDDELPAKEKVARSSQWKLPQWALTGTTMAVAVLAVFIALVSIIVSGTRVSNQDLQILQLQVNTQVNYSNHEMSRLQQELVRQKEELQNGEI